MGKKRSYIDSSANYRKEKPGMRGMSAGTMPADDGKLQRARIISAITNDAFNDRAYSKWNRVDKDYGDVPSEIGVPWDEYRDAHEHDQLSTSNGGAHTFNDGRDWRDMPEEYNKEWEPEIYAEQQAKKERATKKEKRATNKGAAYGIVYIQLKRCREDLEKLHTEIELMEQLRNGPDSPERRAYSGLRHNELKELYMTLKKLESQRVRELNELKSANMPKEPQKEPQALLIKKPKSPDT